MPDGSSYEAVITLETNDVATDSECALFCGLMVEECLLYVFAEGVCHLGGAINDTDSGFGDIARLQSATEFRFKNGAGAHIGNITLAGYGVLKQYMDQTSQYQTLPCAECPAYPQYAS